MATAARRAWKRRSDARPAELRAAALRLFAEHGYGGTTIEEIAQAGDVTVGTIYRYFRDKQALLHEIVEWASAEPLLPPTDSTRPPNRDDWLQHLGETIWAASRKEPHVHVLRLLVSEGGNAPQLVERYRTRVLEPVEQTLAECLAALGRTTDSIVAARALLGAILGASVLAGSADAPTPVVPQLAPLEMTVTRLVAGFSSRRGASSPATPIPREPTKPPSRPRTPDSW